MKYPQLLPRASEAAVEVRKVRFQIPRVCSAEYRGVRRSDVYQVQPVDHSTLLLLRELSFFLKFLKSILTQCKNDSNLINCFNLLRRRIHALKSKRVLAVFGTC